MWFMLLERGRAPILTWRTSQCTTVMAVSCVIVVLDRSTPRLLRASLTHLVSFTGRDIVNFLEESLADNVARELAHDDDASIDARLERSFLVTDIQSRHMGLVTSGATVAVCLVSQNPNGTLQIHAANAGDARIVLADGNGDAHRLTHDHRADDPDEVARINAAGGFVWKNRVVGILAVARSLGDHGMKEFVIAQPHVQSWSLQADFIIVACDGLWDVFSDQEAVDLVYQWKAYKEDVADYLCKEAVARGSSDNVTVIVSWLI